MKTTFQATTLSKVFASTLLTSLLVSPSLFAVTVTASSVESLKSNLNAVEPAVLSPALPSTYLSPFGCLGGLGALGAYGPLGKLGPLGDESWNVSKVMGLLPDWTNLTKHMALNGGPLSDQGPLGPKGPLGHEAYFETLPAISDFAKQLQLGGVWTVLGPLGPLGALGPLGPLGPVGAHGFRTDSSGNYLDEELKIQRSITVGKGSKAHEFDLFEMYSESHAKTMKDNDTSFMVLGDTTSEDQFEFTSPERQHVTIVVVPEAQMDVFFSQAHIHERRRRSHQGIEIEFFRPDQLDSNRCQSGRENQSHRELGDKLPFLASERLSPDRRGLWIPLQSN
jgi:hypothetical protein